MLNFNQYPYINLTDLNLDFMIKVIGQLEIEVRDFVSINAIKYADPIQWDITRNYEKNTVVIDGNSGVAYISVAPVPSGVALTRPEYWTVIFDLSMFITKGAANFANSYEVNPTVTATMDTNEGDWLVWDSTLYQALTNIHAGDTYTPDGNIKQMTVEDFYNILVGLLQAEAQTRADEDTRIELELTDLINSQIGIEAQTRADEDTRIELELTDLINSQIGIEAQTRADEDTRIEALIKSNLVKCCETRADVAGVNVEVGSFILAANAYAGDGIMSLYEVTSGAADGYINIAMNNGNTAELQYNNIIHAHQVGAFPDGSDCVTAINAIIDNVSTVTIKFDKGRYTFSDRIWLNSNQSIIGEGDETTLYINQDPILQHGEFIGIIGENGVIIENVTLKNFNIDIYYLPSSTEDVNAIGVVSAKNITIENVNVLRSNWRGFQFEGEAGGTLEHVVVRNCSIYDCYLNGIGLSHGAGGSLNDILFENIFIENSNTNGGIWIQGASASDINMKDIVLRDIKYNGGTTRGIYALYAENITVNTMTVSNISPTLYGVNQFQGCRQIAINNLTVLSDAANTNNYSIMLYDSDDVIISGLICRNATIGIQIQNGCDNVVVANSSINSRTGGTPIRNTDASLKGYIAACVYNNTISNASTSFVELS